MLKRFQKSNAVIESVKGEKSLEDIKQLITSLGKMYDAKLTDNHNGNYTATIGGVSINFKEVRTSSEIEKGILGPYDAFNAIKAQGEKLNDSMMHMLDAAKRLSALSERTDHPAITFSENSFTLPYYKVDKNLGSLKLETNSFMGDKAYRTTGHLESLASLIETRMFEMENALNRFALEIEPSRYEKTQSPNFEDIGELATFYNEEIQKLNIQPGMWTKMDVDYNEETIDSISDDIPAVNNEVNNDLSKSDKDAMSMDTNEMTTDL